MVLDNFPNVRMTLSKVNLVYGQICGKYGENMGNVKPINTWPYQLRNLEVGSKRQ